MDQLVTPTQPSNDNKTGHSAINFLSSFIRGTSRLKTGKEALEASTDWKYEHVFRTNHKKTLSKLRRMDAIRNSLQQNEFVPPKQHLQYAILVAQLAQSITANRSVRYHGKSELWWSNKHAICNCIWFEVICSSLDACRRHVRDTCVQDNGYTCYREKDRIAFTELTEMALGLAAFVDRVAYHTFEYAAEVFNSSPEYSRDTCKSLVLVLQAHLCWCISQREKDVLLRLPVNGIEYIPQNLQSRLHRLGVNDDSIYADPLAHEPMDFAQIAHEHNPLLPEVDNLVSESTDSIHIRNPSARDISIIRTQATMLISCVRLLQLSNYTSFDCVTPYGGVSSQEKRFASAIPQEWFNNPCGKEDGLFCTLTEELTDRKQKQTTGLIFHPTFITNARIRLADTKDDDRYRSFDQISKDTELSAFQFDRDIMQMANWVHAAHLQCLLELGDMYALKKDDKSAFALYRCARRNGAVVPRFHAYAESIDYTIKSTIASDITRITNKFNSVARDVKRFTDDLFKGIIVGADKTTLFIFQ